MQQSLIKNLADTYKYFGAVKGTQLTAREVMRRFFGVHYTFGGTAVNSIAKYMFVKTLGMLQFYRCSVVMDEVTGLIAIKCPDGSKWIVRSDVEAFRMDIRYGPFLNVLSEPIEWDLVSQVLKRGSTFIDVGAYIGGYAVRASLKGAKVIALEPEPLNFKILSMNVEANGFQDNTVLLNVAAGREEKAAYLTKKLITSSLLTSNESSVEVLVCPLDKIVQKYLPKYSMVDVLKIDVEGTELDVIEGAVDTLNRTRFLLIELWRKSRDEALRMLRNLNFEIVKAVERKEDPDYYDVFLEKRA